MDQIATTTVFPKEGETVLGEYFSKAPGGKGANQAVAAARLGADVVFITCLGNDASGGMLSAQFAADGIDTSCIKLSATPTGTALIFVDDNAENCIAVAPGSNNDLLPADIDAARSTMEGASYLLVQLVIPMPTVVRAVELAHSLGIKTIMNPAPMNPVPEELFSRIWLITPNQTEAEQLTGVHVESEDDAARAAEVLFAKGVKNVIVTMGSKGSLVCTPEGREFVPSRKVKAIDTTGAGDVYNGALVAALSQGKSLIEAARIATLASSIAVTRMGAQTSAPYANEIESL